jgi:hypothetical protein
VTRTLSQVTCKQAPAARAVISARSVVHRDLRRPLRRPVLETTKSGAEITRMRSNANFRPTTMQFASSPLVRRRRRHLGQDLVSSWVSVIIRGGAWGRGEVDGLGRGYWFEDSRFRRWDVVVFGPGQHEDVF